jgi:hypothetical protein
MVDFIYFFTAPFDPPPHRYGGQAQGSSKGKEETRN